MIWPNKTPPDTIFMDKEIELAFPPDIFADFRFCPFRDNVFDCVIFDPPHTWTLPPWWNDPKTSKKRRGNLASWYGKFENKRDMLSSIHKAQKEFSRISKRLCLKWSELKVSLWKILPFFDKWSIIQTKKHRGKYKVGKTKTFWVTFVPKKEIIKPKIEDELIDLQYKFEIDKIHTSGEKANV